MVSIPSSILHPFAFAASKSVIRIPPRAFPVLALIGANVIWGAAPAVTKAAQVNIGPLTVGAGRLGIAVLVFAVVLRLRGERMAKGREPAILGLFGMALYCVFHNYGLVFADATTTSLIGGAMPVLIAALAVPVLGERLRAATLAGIMLSIAGVATIVLVGSTGSPEATLGGLLPLASTVVFSLYAVCSRRVFGSANALAIVAGATRYGFFVLLPGAVVEAGLGGTPAATVGDAMLVLYLGVACSAIGFALYGYAIVSLGAARSAAFFNLRVLGGVALSVVLFGDALTPARLIGGALVLFAVVVASRSDTGSSPIGETGRLTAPTSRTTREGQGHAVSAGATP